VEWQAASEKDLSAEALARELMDMWVRNSVIFDDTISDRDTSFMSYCLGSRIAQLGIRFRHCTAYQPQTDGKADNLNAVLQCYLKAYVAQHPKVCDCLLLWAEFTHNAMYDESLKIAPFLANLALMPWMPIDPRISIPSANWMPKVSLEADEFAQQIMPNIRMLRERLEEA